MDGRRWKCTRGDDWVQLSLSLLCPHLLSPLWLAPSQHFQLCRQRGRMAGRNLLLLSLLFLLLLTRVRGFGVFGSSRRYGGTHRPGWA